MQTPAAGKRVTGVAQRDQQRDREAAPGGVACDDDAPRIDTRSHQPAIRRQRVVHGGREGILGTEAIVDGQRARARRRREAGHQGAMRAHRSDRVAAAVEVEQRRIGLGTGRLDPLARHAARLDRGEARALGERRRAGELLHVLAALVDVHGLWQWRRAAQHLDEHRDLGAGHGRRV